MRRCRSAGWSAERPVQAGGVLAGGLTGGLAGVVGSVEALGGSLNASLNGLAQTGVALATIWANTTHAVADALAGGLSATVGVAFPGVFQTGESLAAGISGVLSGIGQTGGSLITSLQLALNDLGLSLQTALNASVGIGVTA